VQSSTASEAAARRGQTHDATGFDIPRWRFSEQLEKYVLGRRMVGYLPAPNRVALVRDRVGTLPKIRTGLRPPGAATRRSICSPPTTITSGRTASVYVPSTPTYPGSLIQPPSGSFDQSTALSFTRSAALRAIGRAAPGTRSQANFICPVPIQVSGMSAGHVSEQLPQRQRSSSSGAPLGGDAAPAVTRRPVETSKVCSRPLLVTTRNRSSAASAIDRHHRWCDAVGGSFSGARTTSFSGTVRMRCPRP
jgi:hypothetical protein